ncbi:TonB-dependent receptor domain-containing protein [Methylophilus methylotrophus]|uniref:TonB-dependent receptor domain-containing protein n=1 Tax=Methylophilus methylotrophus TaxID=17 RepID=UPI000F5B25C5|nr:TonB-dependent receptor [Methylophilus methylotrophus]
MHTPKKLILGAAIAACFSSQPAWINPLWAAELNTNLPQSEEDVLLSQKITINLPAQPLAASLKALSAKIGLNITYNDKLVSDKQAPALSGTMPSKEALQKLLANTGLEAKLNDNTLYIQRLTKVEAKEIQLDKVEVRAKRFYEVGPLPGLGLTREEIPGNVQSLTAQEIKESHALNLADLMNRKLQSVSVNDYQGNPFQMDVNYRGFTASPQLGTAQGISVFFDGIRVNEPFGDIVNWDMLPMNAIASLDVFPGSNPVFGLGTLGGALSMRTKSGFDGKLLDAEILTGSFGRKQLQASAGGNNGVIAGFVSGNIFLEDGWRDDSPSKVNQLFGKAEWQSERARVGLTMLYAGNKLTGNGLLPEQMANQDRSQIYTSPDVSRNNLLQFQLSGIWDVTDTFNITGQIYNRKSKRKSSMADVNENFGGTDGRPNWASVKDPNRQLLYGLPDINRDGLPDYNNYAYNVAADANGNPLTNSGTVCDIFADPSCADDLAIGTNFNTQANANQAQVMAQDGSGNMVWNWTYDPRRNLDDLSLPSNVPDAFNAPVTAQYNQLVRTAFQNFGIYFHSLAETTTISTELHPGVGSATYSYNLYPSFGQGGALANYTDEAGFYHDYWELFVPVNAGNITNPIGSIGGLSNLPTIGPLAVDANGRTIFRDGKYGGGAGYLNTGYIEGTPTAIFTDTQIDQIGKGASLQLNWNLEKHKFMLGGSIDKADTTYVSNQYLGLLDANRHGYIAPELLGWEYYANTPDKGYALNDFKGDSLTRSLYLSETWTPVKNLSFTASARYNRTSVNNQLSVARLSSYTDVNTILNFLNLIQLCTDNNNDGSIDPNTECPNGLNQAIVPFDPITFPTDAQGQNISTLRPPEKEMFKYRSFNPSFGVTWQANEDLNLYANIGRGARTPTVIELGCAYDPTPLSDGRPRSIAEQRVCNLPGALAGDPYLKQVRSTSYEMGARGRFNDSIEWNTSIYQTDLSDDIYFVAVNATSSYFQNVGNTRRRGLEMGVKGKVGKARFGLNYALTDATFQSPIDILSAHNSSAGNVYDIITATQQGTYGKIKVEPGNRMPGIPLHNLNANLSYDVTDNWTIGLNAVMHSSAYVRGNENNKHQAGPATPLIGPFCIDPVTGVTGVMCNVPRADFGPGKTSGYTVFNFQTSYKITPEWTLGFLVNNVFDKEYASAGRLGANAFSPSIRGTIGVSGFNYNSADWQGSSFLGLGAPRSAFITLSYEFQPKKLDGLVE